jgi:6-phosphogluconolactonase (cycloisomerase 2 family)
VGISPSSFTVDAAEHFMFVTNSSTSTVSVFAITSTSGALTQIPGSPFATTTAATSTIPVDVAVSPSGTNLYVLNSGPNNISEFTIGGTGALTLLTASPVGSSGTGPVFILFDSNPKFVFVGNQGSNNISVFSVNSDGTLANTQTPGTLGASPSSMFVLP